MPDNLEQISDNQNCVSASYIRQLKRAAEDDITAVENYGLNDLSDVSGVAAQNNDGLIYNSSSGEWEKGQDTWDVVNRVKNGYIDDIDEHFEDNSLGIIGNFAGAPFAGVPNNSFSHKTFWRCLGGGGVNGRTFAYAPVNVAAGGTFQSYTSLAVDHTNGFAGLRMDDGTDNNYAEFGVVSIGGSNATVDIVARIRTGGGAVSNIIYTIVPIGIMYKIRMLAFSTNIYCYYKSDTPLFHFLGTPLLGRTFNITRTGLVHQNSGGSTISEALFDFYHQF